VTRDDIVAAPLAGRTIGALDGDFVVAEWSDAGETSRDWPIAPLHVHHRDDEAWYVLEGTLGFRLGDDEVEVGAGSAVFAPRGVPHTFWNAGPGEARYLLVMSTRIARLIEELHSGAGQDPDAVFRTYESDLLR